MNRLKFWLAFLIIWSVNIDGFGQNLYIGGQDVTNSTVFVQYNQVKQFTVVATLSGATNSLWNSLDTTIVSINPAIEFPFVGSAYSHQVTIQVKSPGGKLFVKFLMPTGTIVVDSIMFQYILYPMTTLVDTSIFACENEVKTFHATTANTEYLYSWQFRTSSTGSWMSSAEGIGNNLTVQMTSSKQGYQYRCIVGLTSCLTCTDTTGIITIQSVAQAPAVSDLPSIMINTCGQNSLSLSTVSISGANYQWYWLDGTTWIPTTDGPNYTGSNNNTLNILDVSAISGTRYVVRVNIGSCYNYGQ